MKIKTNRGDLAGHLAWVAQAAPRASQQPVLAGVHLRAVDGGLGLRATDYDTWLSTTVDADVSEHGETLVSAHRLRQVVAEATNDEITLTVANNRLQVKCGRSSYRFPLLPLEDYPKPPAAETDTGAPTVTVSADSLRHLVHTTSAAVARSSDKGVPASLFGVHLTSADGELTAHASDRFRVSRVSVTCTGGDVDALPGHVELAAAAKAMDGEVALSVSGGALTVADARRTATIRTIAEDFPAVGRWFDQRADDATTITFDGSDVVAALTRLGAIAEPRKPTILDTGKGTVTFKASGEEHGAGTETVDAVIEGNEAHVGFNVAFLAALLRSCPSGKVRVGIPAHPHLPLLLGPVGSSRQAHLCMPLREIQ